MTATNKEMATMSEETTTDTSPVDGFADALLDRFQQINDRLAELERSVADLVARHSDEFENDHEGETAK